MTGFTYLVWYLCTIAFFPLLAYAVVKRPYWFPGLVVTSYPNVGMARLSIPMLGIVRGYILIALISLILICSTLMKRIKMQRYTHERLSFADQAPVFLLVMLFLMLFRMSFDYVSSGRLFYITEIPAALVGTFLPLLILIIYYPQDDHFPEVLRGIAIGSLLSVLPAFMDFENLRNLFENFISSGMIIFEKSHFRDRNTDAYFAFNAAISLFCLCIMGYLGRFRKIGYPLVVVLITFMLLNQSRRWFLSFLTFGILYFLFCRKYRTVPKRTPAEMVVLRIIPGTIFFLIGTYMVWSLQSRFERLDMSSMINELRSSEYVKASYSRADLAKEAFKAFKEYPLYGSGMLVFGWEKVTVEGKTGKRSSAYIGSHNLIMDILVQYGIIGALCAFIFFFSMFRSVKKWLTKRRNSPFSKKLLLLVIYWISLLAVSVTGGVAFHSMGLIALIPAAMRLLIMEQARTLPLKRG